MILFTTLVLFVLFGTIVSSLVVGDVVLKTLVANRQSVYAGNGIELQPASDSSDIWLIDDEVFLYGSFWIRNSTTYDEMEIDNTVYVIDGSWRILDISNLNSGSYTINLRLEGRSVENINIWASSTNLWFSKFLWPAFLLFFLSLCALTGMIPAYLLLMRPLRKAIGQFEIGESKRKNLRDPDKDKVDWLIERTDSVRTHLSGQIVHYQKMKNTLLTAIGILFAAYGLLLTEVIPVIGDSNIQSILVVALVVGIIYLLSPANKLLSDYRFDERLTTSWYHQGRISVVRQRKSRYEMDLERNYDFICNWEKGEILKDNTREIISLYYESRAIENQYNEALSGVKGSVLLLASIIFTFVIFSYIITQELMILFTFGYSIYLLYLMFSSFLDWYTEELVVINRILYHCRDTIDDSLEQNKGFQNIEATVLELDVSVETTCEYNSDEMLRIQTQVEKASRKRGRWPKKKKHLYGPEKGNFSWVGKQVPILIQEVVGETSSVSVYPNCDKKGTITTIENHLEICKEEELFENYKES